MAQASRLSFRAARPEPSPSPILALLSTFLKMTFSIITPSRNQLNWLQLCAASVADQGVPVEHIIQDACSTDGTLEWLQQSPQLAWRSERDGGMYDAINRGLRRANGDILAYLNCDEQYLPGTLRKVQECFEANPHIDVVLGDIVIVDAAGEYLFHWKVLPPQKYHTWVSHLASLSCAVFFRRKLIAEDGFYFNEKLRDVGDGDWMLRLLRRGVRMKSLGAFTSVFACTGANMSVGANAKREARELFRSAPLWAQIGKPAIILHHRLRKLVGGSYTQKPFEFSLYTRQSPNQRVLRQVTRPTSRWKL